MRLLLENVDRPVHSSRELRHGGSLDYNTFIVLQEANLW